MKKKKWQLSVLASVMCLVMLASLTACGESGKETTETATKEKVTESEVTDALSIKDAAVTTLTPKLDGKDISVTMYEDVYCANPNSNEQMISVYVTEGATAASPILFLVNNSGWLADTYAARKQVKSYGMEEQTDRTGETSEVQVGDYVSTSDDDIIGAALSRDFVIVSYGCRARNDEAVNGEYLGHSPATMTDTKAAIRYLRYNSSELGVGDTNKIIISGTSGGGALSVAISADGNSSDFYESLYEIGAAGIEMDGSGKYVSTINDDVFATLAYCPINDLGPSDLAYEWTYNETRKQLISEGATWTAVSGMPGDENAKVTDITDEVMQASQELYDEFPEHLAGYGLKTETGEDVTADNIDSLTAALMEREIKAAIEEVGIDQMKKDMEGDGSVKTTWLTLNEDKTFEYNYQNHLLYVAKTTELKAAPAFSNLGLELEARNEDSLFGTKENAYCAFVSYSWNNDKVKGNGCGKDDTGLTWDEFMQTDEGKAVALQIKMASPIEYLLSDSDGDSAPYWYVRHGMIDRDISFTSQTILYYAMLNDSSIKEINFSFDWLRPHSGQYDIQEAFAWVDSILNMS